jgi:hypothetical protein
MGAPTKEPATSSRLVRYEVLKRAKKCCELCCIDADKKAS